MIATLTRFIILLQLSTLAAISFLFVRFDVIGSPALASTASVGAVMMVK